MNRGRAVLAAAAVWCAVVAVVATLVWVVISRAGAGVVPEATPGADVTASLPVAGDRSDRGPVPGVVLTPRASTQPGGATGTPATPPTSSGTASPSTGSPAPPAPAVQRRSWDGAAGHVVAECRGSSGRLVSAYPSAGWRYAVASTGPVVQVRFRRVGEDHGLAVTGRCQGGVPQFTVTGYRPADE